jgi:DNA invertase Pin-like site-specific DNA recombinase
MEKADQATRKLIRSHVMRGKKQKKARRDKGQQKTGGMKMPERIQAGRVKSEEVIETYRPMLPGRVGSDLSVVVFAAEMEPSMLQNMIRG